MLPHPAKRGHRPVALWDYDQKNRSAIFKLVESHFLIKKAACQGDRAVYPDKFVPRLRRLKFNVLLSCY